MKKAVVSNVFVIFVGVFVIAFLLAMGYLWVGNLKKNIETIDYSGFKSSFAEKIEANLYKGSEDNYGIAVPNQVTKVCFGSFEKGDNDDLFTGGEYALIKQTLANDNLKENVFLFRTDDSVDKEFIDKLKPGTGFDDDANPCIENERGKLKIKLIGFGRYVEVSPS